MVHKIGRKLDQAWSFKINQQELLFLQSWSEIVSLTGISADHQPDLFLAQDCHLFSHAERLQLAATFAYHLRRYGEKEKSRLWLRAAKNYVPLVPPSFALYVFYLEQGTQHLHLGSFSEAYEAYQQALVFASEPLHHALALVNVLLCEENLGLDLQITYQKIKSILSDLPNGASSVRQQLNAYEERALFRAGQLNLLLSMNATNSPGQERYYQSWVSELPYVDSNKYHYDKKIKDLDAYPYANLRPFLRRTLLVAYQEEDLHNNVLIHMIDRIYLWLWKFLAEPTVSLAQHLLLMLNTLKFPDDLRRLTCEDQLMLRNVLLWLSVVDPTQAPVLANLIHQIPQPHPGFSPLLEFESKLAQECLSQSTDSLGSKAELARLPELAKMHDIAMSLVKSNLSKLYELDKIYVDIQMGQVYKNKVCVSSSELATAIQLLASTETLSLERFAKACFRLKDYREDSHKRRVFLLNKRVKEVLGPLAKISVSGGEIARSGFENVKVVMPELGHAALVKNDLWLKFIDQIRFESASGLSKIESRILSHLKGEARTQKELSLALGVAKTTMLRRLKDLVNKDQVQIEGAGRAMRYIAKDDHSRN